MAKAEPAPDAIDLEIEALTAVHEAIKTLPEPARLRVLRWAHELHIGQAWTGLVFTESGRPGDTVGAAPRRPHLGLDVEPETPAMRRRRERSPSKRTDPLPPVEAKTKGAQPPVSRLDQARIVRGPNGDVVKFGGGKVVSAKKARELVEWIRGKSAPVTSEDVATKYGIERATAKIQLRACEVLDLIEAVGSKPATGGMGGRPMQLWAAKGKAPTAAAGGAG